MRKYLREIEISGVILAAIGIVCAMVWVVQFGMWPCGLGLLLLLVTFLYKAFHWKEYERENKQYIMIILLTIAILFFQMLTRR